jgi:MFS family permease
LADSSEQQAQPISWGVKAVILAGGPAISLCTSLIQAVLPAMTADLARGPDDAFLVKMMVGLNTLAMAIGAALTGFLVDRFGLRRVMAGCYGVYAIAGTAGVYLNDLHLLLVSRFVLGLAAAGAVTGSIIIINARMGLAQRATWLGYYNAVAQLGSVVLNPIGGLLAEVSWHWSFALYGIAAPFAVIAFTALGGRKSEAVTETRPAGPPLLSWFPFRFAFLGICLGFIVYIPAVYLSFLLHNLGMTSPALISLVLTGDIIAGSISAALYGRARRVLSEYQAFSISVACSGLGLLIAALAPSVVLVIAGSVLFGVGVAWFQPNLMFVLAGRVAPDQQARAAGLVKSSVYLGAPIAMYAAEPVSRSFGASGAILVAVAVSAGLFVVALPKLMRRPSTGSG